MAKVNDLLGNDISGRVGTVVYAKVNGQTIIRSLPKVDPNKRTPAQLRNQERFRRIHQFGAQFKWILIPQIWNDYSKTDNGYNLFIKANTPAFGPDGELLDPKKIRLSIGDLLLPPQMDAHRATDGSNFVEVIWQKGSLWGGIHLRDELMVISLAEGEYSDIKATGLMRGNLGGRFELPQQPAPVTHIYLFFASLDRRHYSESVCFEIGN